jgi:hypothetical protein
MSIVSESRPNLQPVLPVTDRRDALDGVPATASLQGAASAGAPLRLLRETFRDTGCDSRGFDGQRFAYVGLNDDGDSSHPFLVTIEGREEPATMREIFHVSEAFWPVEPPPMVRVLDLAAKAEQAATINAEALRVANACADAEVAILAARIDELTSAAAQDFTARLAAQRETNSLRFQRDELLKGFTDLLAEVDDYAAECVAGSPMNMSEIRCGLVSITEQVRADYAEALGIEVEA